MKVTLQGTEEPVVWRRIAMQSSTWFDELHRAIQEAMGWKNCHDYVFVDDIKKPKWRIVECPTEYNLINDIEKEADMERLSARLRKPGKKFYYIYDLGDNWVHEVELEQVLESDNPLAECLAGEGACPPEDVGGAPMYKEMCRVLREEPDSDTAKQCVEWLGLTDAKKFKPKSFSVARANQRIKKAFFGSKMGGQVLNILGDILGKY